MKVAIMQPYFFPYIGYWQLLNAVDQFVIFNDVNFINRGWINRNRILCHGKPLYINVLLNKASQNRKINEIEVIQDQKQETKLLRTLRDCYCKAPCFQPVFDMVSDVLLENDETYLDRYLYRTMQAVCDYIGIKTPMVFSSEIPTGTGLRGQDRILDICKRLGASEYYNAIGGQQLYDAKLFYRNGISLKFLETKSEAYRQGTNEFVPSLSIIDVLMNNSKGETLKLLNQFVLL